MARLGDVCTVVSGSTPKSNIPEYWDGSLNWITPAELTEDNIVINESQRKITEAGARSAGLSAFPAGTVILSSRAPIGKTAIAGVEMYCNQGFKNLICSDAIYNKYLFWFLRGKTDYLNSLGRGATFNHAHVVRFKDFSLQKYIEVCFSLIDISEYITGSAQPKLNQAKLNAIQFAVPSLELLKEFSAFIEQIDLCKSTIQRSLDKLETLKSALMQEYFG